MSFAARDLIRKASEIYEDAFWAKEAQAREATFVKKKALTHEEVWAS